MKRFQLGLITLTLSFALFACGKNNFSDDDFGTSRFAMPQNVEGVSEEVGSVTLSWDPVDGAEHYKIHHGDSVNVDDEEIFTTQTSKTISNLPAGEDRYFSVVADGSEHEASVGSTAIEVYVLESGETPPPNGSLSAPTLTVDADPKELKLSWGAVSEATSYKLEEKKDNSSAWLPVSGYSSGTSHSMIISVHRLKWAEAKVRVQACNLDGCGPFDTKSISSAMLDAIGAESGSSSDFDGFGFSVAVSGDGKTMAIGVPLGDYMNKTDAGAIHVFTRSASGDWSFSGITGSVSAAQDDLFGHAISLSSDGLRMAIGSPGKNGNKGAVHVYQRSGSTVPWGSVAYFESGNSQAERFGRSVAISDDGLVVAVGAPYKDIDNRTNAGAVHLYTNTSGYSWSEKYVVGADSNSYSYFGSSVALDGNGVRLIVGARGEEGTYGSGIKEGAVYMMRKSGGSIITDARFTGGSDGAQFGSSVSVSDGGGLVAVGAPKEYSGLTEMGKVRVYKSSGAENWALQTSLVAFQAGVKDHFGSSVALSGDGKILAVGAYDEDGSASGVHPHNVTTNNGTSSAGAVYTFTQPAGSSTWSKEAYVKATSPDTLDHFGSALSLSQDGGTMAVGTFFAGKAFFY